MNVQLEIIRKSSVSHRGAMPEVCVGNEEDHVYPEGCRCPGRDMNWSPLESKSSDVPLRKPARRMPVCKTLGT